MNHIVKNIYHLFFSKRAYYNCKFSSGRYKYLAVPLNHSIKTVMSQNQLAELVVTKYRTKYPGKSKISRAWFTHPAKSTNDV